VKELRCASEARLALYFVMHFSVTPSLSRKLRMPSPMGGHPERSRSSGGAKDLRSRSTLGRFLAPLEKTRGFGMTPIFILGCEPTLMVNSGVKIK
jgi:hypothetical protein